MTTNKTWWAPVWRGLVVDAEAKHCRRMKNAVWLFLHFVVHANRGTGTLKRKCRTIAEEMGLPEATIRKWLSTLKKHGYIDARNNGRCLEIVINKWKSFPHSSSGSSQSAKSWP